MASYIVGRDMAAKVYITGKDGELTNIVVSNASTILDKDDVVLLRDAGNTTVAVFSISNIIGIVIE